MNMRMTLATLLATGSLLVAATGSANAASLATDAFLANVRPNVDFLDQSSRLALDHAAGARLRAFAHSEAIEQTIAFNSLVAYAQTNTTRGEVRAVAGTGAPVLAAPVAVAEAPIGVATDLLSGRSVALDVPVAVAPAPVTPPPGLLPAGKNDLDRLAALDGRNFDALYLTTQRDALRQLSTLYASYIQNGDDPDLRAMATRELPKINRRLAEIRHL